jgi:hypothetical protein
MESMNRLRAQTGVLRARRTSSAYAAGVLAIATLALLSAGGVAATTARAVCLTPAESPVAFGNQLVFTTTARPNHLTVNCGAEGIEFLAPVKEEGDSPELHPAPTKTCKIEAGQTLLPGGECEIPFWFEPLVAKAYSATDKIMYETIPGLKKETLEIKLSGTGKAPGGPLPAFLPAANKGISRNKNKTKFTEKSGIAAVECAGSEGTSAIESAKAGKFEETYTGCSALLSGKCTGLANTTAGDITIAGEFRLRFLKSKEKENESAALIFLIPQTHFECEKNVVLILVHGCVAGGITPVNAKAKTFTVELKQTGGVEVIKEVENEEGTGNEICVLKSEKNGEAEKEAGQEQKDEISEETEGGIST